MPLSGGGNKWTDHVRAFATSKGVSYMCAMSDPQCSATYKGRKPKMTKEQKKEKKENITMSMEDKPAPARGESLGDIFESATPFEGSTPPRVRAVLKNKGSLNKTLEKKLADQQGMLAEDVNRAVPDTKGKPKGKAGRPAKYASAEEARQAKIANTIRRAKERVSEKKDTKLSARIERAKKEFNKWAEGLESNVHTDGKGKRTENASILEKIETMKKRFPSLKVSDYYRTVVIKSDPTDKIQTVALPAELTTRSGKGFDVGMPKVGGMLGWVKSIIGRHPQLTRAQIEQAERFADDLMADPRGITFEGASVIPIDVRKELAQEFYNRSTMSREDKDAIGTAGETFADEVRKQFEAQEKKKTGKGAVGGRRKKAFGLGDFVEGLNKMNPVMWGIRNHPEVGIKLGQVTNNELLPAVVTVGKPVYDATAIATATAFTGNPLLGKVVADEFWNEFGAPYDPRNRQHNEALRRLSEKAGDIAGKEATKLGKGKKKGGSTPPPPPKKQRCSPVRRVSPVAPQIPIQMPMPNLMPLPMPMPDTMFRPISPAPPYTGEIQPIRPKPRRPKGGATALQKGLSAEMRSYTKPPLQHELNQIIHSNDARSSKFGQTPNTYRDYTNSFDPKAQKQIEKALAILIRQGVIPPPPQLKATAPVFVPKAGKGLLGGEYSTEDVVLDTFLTSVIVGLGYLIRNALIAPTPPPDDEPFAPVVPFNNAVAPAPTDIEAGARLGADPRTYTPAYLNRPRLGADPSTYTPAYLSQGGGVLGDYSAVIKHLLSHITDPKEPVDPRDYKHTIRLINGIRTLKGGMGYHGGADDRGEYADIDEINRLTNLVAPAPPPPTPEEAEEPDDGLGGIDWYAIGQALLNDADGYDPDGPNAPIP